MIKELILFALVSLSVSAETVPPGPAYVIKPVESAFKWITKDNPDLFDFDGQPKLPTKCVKEPKNMFPTETCIQTCFATPKAKCNANANNCNTRNQDVLYNKERCSEARCKLGFVCYHQASMKVKNAIYNILGTGVCELVNSVYTKDKIIHDTCNNSYAYRTNLFPRNDGDDMKAYIDGRGDVLAANVWEHTQKMYKELGMGIERDKDIYMLFIHET